MPPELARPAGEGRPVESFERLLVPSAYGRVQALRLRMASAAPAATHIPPKITGSVVPLPVCGSTPSIGAGCVVATIVLPAASVVVGLALGCVVVVTIVVEPSS